MTKEVTQSNVERRNIERTILFLFGHNSMAMKALDLVCSEMSAENGYSRNDGKSYYVHCIAVANSLITAGINEQDAICAALLHDIIEDVEKYNETRIADLFNERVAKLVMLVTKKNDIDYKMPENMKEYLDGIMEYENEEVARLAAAIKAADIMNNSMSWKKLNAEGLYQKACETNKYYLPFLKKCRKSFPRYTLLFDSAITPVEAVIFQITHLYEDVIRPLEIENETLRKLLEEKK